MKKQINIFKTRRDSIIEDHQNVFSNLLKRFKNYDGYLSIDTWSGWYPLIIKIDYELSKIDPNYTISQIKSKFGQLRFYAQPSNKIKDKQSKDFLNTIEIYENLSSFICEKCSYYPVKQNKDSFLETICENCKKERKIT